MSPQTHRPSIQTKQTHTNFSNMGKPMAPLSGVSVLELEGLGFRAKLETDGRSRTGEVANGGGTSKANRNVYHL